MTRLTRCALLVAALALVLATPAGAARPDRHAYALQLLAEGRRELALGGFDHRRKALDAFEAAAIVAPRDPEVLVTLGDCYCDARYLHRARAAYERALRVAPLSAASHYGMARMIRREWLDSGWRSDLDSAVAQAREATRLDGSYAAAWEGLVALAIEDGQVDVASDAAAHALAAAPADPRAQLAAAALVYRGGQLARSDSLFRAALAGLDSATAAPFRDISPLLPDRDNAARRRQDAARRAETVRRFWAAHDPDPVTPENEAQLEYWSRQAHALLLLDDPWGPIWRERTAVYVRYGRIVQVEETLGGGRFEMPRLDLGAVADAPTPKQLERLGQQVAGGGQSAFAPLPPTAQPLTVYVRIVRFEGERGPHLLAMVEAPGTPGDALTAECVLVDADERIAERTSRALTPSACDPGAARAGEFDFDVTPGPWRVAVAVHDAGLRRGVRTVPCDALPLESGLTMSEIAPNCGPPELASARDAVRLAANPRGRVAGSDPLVAYFEIYHLATEGQESRFEYEYTVRELGAPGVPWYRQRGEGSAAAQGLAFQSTQRGVGSLRRQFIRVPTRVLPAGRYELQLKVHDLVSGSRVYETLPFLRLWSEQELSGEAPVPGEPR